MPLAIVSLPRPKIGPGFVAGAKRLGAGGPAAVVAVVAKGFVRGIAGCSESVTDSVSGLPLFRSFKEEKKIQISIGVARGSEYPVEVEVQISIIAPVFSSRTQTGSTYLYAG